jgi:hypothetical protein
MEIILKVLSLTQLDLLLVRSACCGAEVLPMTPGLVDRPTVSL